MEKPRWLPLNLELMSHPANWLIVGLMLAIPVLATCYIFGCKKAATTQGNS